MGGTETFQGHFIHSAKLVDARHWGSKVKKMCSSSGEEWCVQGSPMRASDTGWEGGLNPDSQEDLTCARQTVREGCGVGGRASLADQTY